MSRSHNQDISIRAIRLEKANGLRKELEKTMSKESHHPQDEPPSVAWKRLDLPITGPGLLNPAGDSTEVAEVPSGWLIKFHHFHGGASGLTSQVVTFIPDALHEWKPLAQSTQWETMSARRTPNFNDWSERLSVYRGWVYITKLATAARVLTLSMVYVPDPASRGFQI